MKKCILMKIEEMTEMLSNEINGVVTTNVIEKELDGEMISIDILEVCHNDFKKVENLFGYAEKISENLAYVEMTDVAFAISNLTNTKLSEKFDIIEANFDNNFDTYISFELC